MAVNPHYTKYGAAAYVGLTLGLIVSKLVGFISWSWYWVLTPIWLPLVIFAVLAIVLIAILGTTKGNPFQ